jgi:hypothetical protein
MNKTVGLLIVLFLFLGCKKKHWENPAEMHYWIGKWQVKELFEQSGSVKNTFTSVKGTIRFKNATIGTAYHDGEYDITYSAPGATAMSNTEETFKGKFKWRLEGLTVVVTMDGGETPIFGIGRAGLASFSLNVDNYKWNYAELRTNPLPPGFSGLSNGCVITRK